MPKLQPPAPATPSLFDVPRPGSNLPEYTVSDLSKQLKKTVEDTYGHVRVRGEICECKLHSSGHLYLTLKDENAVLAAVCWKGQAAKLGLKPAVGMEVVCTGRLTTYPGQSKYQMNVEGMALAGMGALLKLLEDRKQKLQAEGLFDPSRKRPLPFLPATIGVVTSPTGAVIRDILHRLADRFPRHVLVWPVAVQGEAAAAQIAAAIAGFNALPVDGLIPRPDLLIVARGGGSVEDLMPFNEENVVRAAAGSAIPIISAVGHETDTTLIDFASDRRAPTPTAAAEMAVPVRADLAAQLRDDGVRLEQALRRLTAERQAHLALLNRALGDPLRLLEPLMQRLDERGERLRLGWQSVIERRFGAVMAAGGRLRHPRDIVNLAARQLTEQVTHLHLNWRRLVELRLATVNETGGRLRHPRELVNLAAQRLGHLGQRSTAGFNRQTAQAQHRFERLSSALDHLSPLKVLGRGYALVQDENGHVIATASAAQPGQRIRIGFQDGAVGASVDKS